MPWTIGAWNCPRLSEVVQLCPVAYDLLLTPGRCTANAGAVPRIDRRGAGVCPGHCHGPRLDKRKSLGRCRGRLLFVGCMIGYVLQQIDGVDVQQVA